MTNRRSLVPMMVALLAGSTGCVVAAAGAGAGGAYYLTERGAESEVAAPVDRTYEVTRKVFQELGITEGKTSSEQEAGREKRSIEGSTPKRDVTVTVASSGTGSHVEVVARKTTVTWDKDLARKILGRIVEATR